MIDIRTLENLGPDQLFNAFSRAFEDYEMQLEKHELEIMLQRRGFDPLMSFGAFDRDQLVAFTFNGTGTFEGVETAYDTGTGTIKEYRGQGLAKRIFVNSIPTLKKAGIKQYLLEVLQHNQGAVALYRKLGFKVAREFFYFIQSKEILNSPAGLSDAGYSFQPLEVSDVVEGVDFSDFHPSWQNSVGSVIRGMSKFKAMTATFQDNTVAYCIYEPDSGDITALAVDPAHRRHGVGTHLLKEVTSEISSAVVKVINIPTDATGVVAFLSACGIHPAGKQYEMVKEL